VRTAGGGPLPDHGPAGILLPAGARGPAFAIFPNFSAIKRYNNATSYAMAVGHLADRIGGGGPFLGEWPRGDRPLSRSEREEMQRMLTALGHDTKGTDGVVGPNTRAAIRASKQAIQMGLEQTLEEAIGGQFKYPAVAQLFKSADFVEGPMAFAQKRAPQWTGK
jgi:enoyl-CoA hydratase/carnithine racemase